jgi:hypothetical protein
MAGNANTNTNSGASGAGNATSTKTVLGGMATEEKGAGTTTDTASKEVEKSKPAEGDGTSTQKQDGTGSEGKGTDGKGEEGKPKDAPKPIELKLPEGIQADKAMLDGFTKLATEKGISPEAAQAVLDFYVAQQKAAEEQGQKDFEKQQAEARQQQISKWEAEFKANKEFGGANLEATTAAQTAAMKRFGSPKLFELLDRTGLGSHPELQAFAARIGKALGEDTVGSGDGDRPTTQDSDPEAAKHRVLYPTMHGTQSTNQEQ